MDIDVLNTGLSVCNIFVLAVPALLRAQASTPPKTPDVAGIWALTLQTTQGDMTLDATFTQDKEAIKVSIISPLGDERKGEGTIKGEELSWTLPIDTPNGVITFGFKAKLAGGHAMTGEVQMGDFGKLFFSAKLKK